MDVLRMFTFERTQKRVVLKKMQKRQRRTAQVRAGK